uniref:KIAA1958 n=1 Tax=Athene cunicularia TaxID=194338 RepID=A0A663N708_ATHCN
MEYCLHTSSENLSKLVSWAHSHGTICNLIPNLKHLLSVGNHDNLIAMWSCSAGHAYHWPLAATCRAGSQEVICFQDSRSFTSDSSSIMGVSSETQTTSLERYPSRLEKTKLEYTCIRESCDFSFSEPSEMDEPGEECEDESTIFDMVCESSVTDEDSDFELHPQQAPTGPCKRLASSVHTRGQAQTTDESDSETTTKKIKKELPEDYYIVANAELTAGAHGPALALIQMPTSKPRAQAGPSCPSTSKTLPQPAVRPNPDPQHRSTSPISLSQLTREILSGGPLASLAQCMDGTPVTARQVSANSSNTIDARKAISIPLSALQLPGQEEPPATENNLPPAPQPLLGSEADSSPSVSTEPEVSSSQQQPHAASTTTTETSFICFLSYSTKLNKFPVFNLDDDLKYLCISCVSPNTTKATLYVLNVWRYWCMIKGLRDYIDITKVRKLSKILFSQTGFLGDDSPVALVSTVVKYNSQYLNTQTLQEHTDLMFGVTELLKDSQNRPFFSRMGSVEQGNRMNTNRVCYGQIYHEHSKRHKLCPYCLLYKYMYIHQSPTQIEAKSPFYLTAQKWVRGVGNICYEEQRMGLHSLRGTIPQLAKKEKLEHCENFTFVFSTQASRKLVPLGSYQCC